MSSETTSTKKPFRVFYYRGVEANKLIDIPQEKFLELMHTRARRRYRRNTVNQHLVNRLRKAKATPGADGQPRLVKTHQRSAIIMPEMIGSLIAVYQGLGYYLVEVKAAMVGHYLGEFSLTYAPVKHGEKKGKNEGSFHKFVVTN